MGCSVVIFGAVVQYLASATQCNRIEETFTPWCAKVGCVIVPSESSTCCECKCAVVRILFDIHACDACVPGLVGFFLVDDVFKGGAFFDDDVTESTGGGALCGSFVAFKEACFGVSSDDDDIEDGCECVGRDGSTCQSDGFVHLDFVSDEHDGAVLCKGELQRFESVAQLFAASFECFARVVPCFGEWADGDLGFEVAEVRSTELGKSVDMAEGSDGFNAVFFESDILGFARGRDVFLSSESAERGIFPALIFAIGESIF